MRTRWKVVIAVAALAVVGAIAALVLRGMRGDGDALALVRRAADALEQVAARGTVVTSARTPRGLVETQAEVHRGDGRVVMRYLSGPARGVEVLRDGDVVWARGSHGQVRRRAELGSMGWREELLERNWDFRIAGERVVAGREAVLVRGTGPGGELTLALDEETGFPLTIKRADRDGRTISATSWQRVDFSVEPPPRVEPPAAPPEGREHRRRQVTLEELRAAVDFVVLAPTWLPAGFEQQAWYVHEGRRESMAEARYSDGLRPLVILQRSAARRHQHPGLRRQMREHQGPPPGGMRGHFRGAGGDAIRRQHGETMVIVIGPVPVDDLERVADGMKAPR